MSLSIIRYIDPVALPGLEVIRVYDEDIVSLKNDQLASVFCTKGFSTEITLSKETKFTDHKESPPALNYLARGVMVNVI